MKLTKHAHSCVELETDGVKIVFDPGEFEKKSEKISADANAVLITHEHFDHLNIQAVQSALEKNPELKVFGPSAVVEKLGSHGSRVVAVEPGDSFSIGSVPVQVFGTGVHAPIHDSLPSVDNVAYLVANNVYHPGDSFDVPTVPVQTLLLPTSGPWMKLGEAADFVLTVKPQTVIAIHDLISSEAGNGLAQNYLGENGITGVKLTQLKAGKSIKL